MNYSLSGLPTSGDNVELANMVRLLLPTYARTWARLMTTLQACQDGCDRNTDNETLTTQIDGCGNIRLGCVYGNPGHVDGHITRVSNRTLGIVSNPRLSTIPHKWTTAASLDGMNKLDALGRIEFRYVWINSTLVHELGHTFGLKDHHTNPNYYSLMDFDDFAYHGDDGIKQDDRDVLTSMYESHTRNAGW